MEIERAVRSILGDENVVRIEMKPDKNRDDTALLRVVIVLKSEASGPDGDAMLNLNDEIWEILKNGNNDSVPVIKYTVDEEDHVVAAE